MRDLKAIAADLLELAAELEGGVKPPVERPIPRPSVREEVFRFLQQSAGRPYTTAEIIRALPGINPDSISPALATLKRQKRVGWRSITARRSTHQCFEYWVEAKR